MTEQGHIFENSLNALEFSRPKVIIPPIIPLGRNESAEIGEDGYQPTAPADLFEATSVRNESMPSIGQSDSSAFSSVAQSADMSSVAMNSMTVPYSVFSSVGNYAPSPLNTISSCVPFVTTPNSWTGMPPVSVPALPSAATIPVTTVAHNPAILLDSPQLHAALTMGCPPAPSFPEPYPGMVQHMMPASSHPPNFIPFPGIPVEIHQSQGPTTHPQQHIQINEIRSMGDRSCSELDQRNNTKDILNMDQPAGDCSLRGPGQEQDHPQQQQQQDVMPPLEDHDTMVSSTSNLSSPERQRVSPSSLPGLDENGLSLEAVSDNSQPSNDLKEREIQNHFSPDKTTSQKNSSRPAKRRIVQPADKDKRYLEKRKRNNQSAKRSRDARKEREENVSRRADFLERENSILKAQLATLREEARSLRQLLSQRPVVPSAIPNNTHQLP